jgi:hypothetical protein
MKRSVILRILLIGLCFSQAGNRAHAQSSEMQQLLLNIEKLTQLKSILSDMKTGYQVYQQGYGLISGLSQGNFKLHDGFLSGLLAVSKVVSSDRRVPEILSMHAGVVSEYKSAMSRFRRSGSFSISELDYLSGVYENLIRRSMHGMDELLSVLTAGELRMSDADRLQVVARLHAAAGEQLRFLRAFNRQSIRLSLARVRDLGNLKQLQRLYGLTPKP